MGLTTDIGRRIELVAMDPHFHEISIALYLQQHDAAPQLLVHTYSRIDEAAARIDFLVEAMASLGGMERDESTGRLRFSCGSLHHLASKRLFIESCKLPPAEEIVARPLTVFDKKSNAEVSVTALGDGAYRLQTDGEGQNAARRCATVAGGLVKLAQMEWLDREQNKIAFPCGQAHDRLIGLLMVRAQNVRSVERELEAGAARGQLLAPSAQKQ